MSASRVHGMIYCSLLLQLYAGATVNVGVQPSNCMITKLKLDKDRKQLLERRAAPKMADKNKGKYTEETMVVD